MSRFEIFITSSGYHPSRPDHPERAWRVPAAINRTAGLPGAAFETATAADLETAELLHDARYLADLARPFEAGEPGRLLDGGDTLQTPGSLTAALEGVGGAISAVEKLFAGELETALVATRPPGHHACRAEAMGFCLLGTAALAAAHARAAHAARVVVLDFDVHHGNGTQDLFWSETDLFLASSQAKDIWPFTGAASETGAYLNIMNAPLPTRTGDAEAREAWTRMLSWVERVSPDLIVVSAGFDAHRADPLGILKWTTEFYGELGARIREVADKVAGGRVLSILEGGYDLGVLDAAVPRYMAGVLGCDPHLARPMIHADRPDDPVYVSGRAPAPAMDGGFSVIKAYQRLWIQDNATGLFVYTPGPGVRLTGRSQLQELADTFTREGGVDINAIVAFEGTS